MDKWGVFFPGEHLFSALIKRSTRFISRESDSVANDFKRDVGVVRISA